LIEVAAAARDGGFMKTALNDIVVSRGAISRLIKLDVSVDGELVRALPRRWINHQFAHGFNGVFAGGRRSHCFAHRRSVRAHTGLFRTRCQIVRSF